MSASPVKRKYEIEIEEECPTAEEIDRHKKRLRTEKQAIELTQSICKNIAQLASIMGKGDEGFKLITGTVNGMCMNHWRTLHNWLPQAKELFKKAGIYNVTMDWKTPAYCSLTTSDGRKLKWSLVDLILETATNNRKSTTCFKTYLQLAQQISSIVGVLDATTETAYIQNQVRNTIHGQ